MRVVFVYSTSTHTDRRIPCLLRCKSAPWSSVGRLKPRTHAHIKERCPRSAAVRRTGRECQFPAPNNDTWPVPWTSSPVYRCDVKCNVSVTKWLPNIGPFNLALWCVLILRIRPAIQKNLITLFLAWVCDFPVVYRRWKNITLTVPLLYW